MPHDAPIHFGDKRDRERPGGTQCSNDELLRLIADRQRLERSGRNLGDGADIVARFTSDSYLVRHVSEFLAGLANVNDEPLRERTRSVRRHGARRIPALALGPGQAS
jgi:hypothetical protein